MVDPNKNIKHIKDKLLLELYSSIYNDPYAALLKSKKIINKVKDKLAVLEAMHQAINNILEIKGHGIENIKEYTGHSKEYFIKYKSEIEKKIISLRKRGHKSQIFKIYKKNTVEIIKEIQKYMKRV